MKYILLISLIYTLALSTEDVSFKCYKNTSVTQHSKALPSDTILQNNKQVTLRGEGKVIFFYPCGVPDIVKVDGLKDFKPSHKCKQTSATKSLVINFFSTFFKEDEKILISASSRSTTKVSRDNDYFILSRKFVKNIEIPIYDTEADYKIFINKKDYLAKKFIKQNTLYIPTNILSQTHDNEIQMYEDGVKVFDFLVEFIPLKKLQEQYQDQHLSKIEMALLYEKESNKKLYTNSNITYLLK